MRKRELDKVLENAVADALGLPAPHRLAANRNSANMAFRRREQPHVKAAPRHQARVVAHA